MCIILEYWGNTPLCTRSSKKHFRDSMVNFPVNDNVSGKCTFIIPVQAVYKTGGKIGCHTVTVREMAIEIKICLRLMETFENGAKASSSALIRYICCAGHMHGDHVAIMCAWHSWQIERN